MRRAAAVSLCAAVAAMFVAGITGCSSDEAPSASESPTATVAPTPPETPQTGPSSDSELTDRCTLPNGTSLCENLWGAALEVDNHFDFGLDADGTVWWGISDYTSGVQVTVEEGGGTWTSDGDQITITFTEVPSTFTTKTLSLKGTQEGLVSNDPPMEFGQTSG